MSEISNSYPTVADKQYFFIYFKTVILLRLIFLLIFIQNRVLRANFNSNAKQRMLNITHGVRERLKWQGIINSALTFLR